MGVEWASSRARARRDSSVCRCPSGRPVRKQGQFNEVTFGVLRSLLAALDLLEDLQIYEVNLTILQVGRCQVQVMDYKLRYSSFTFTHDYLKTR